MVKEAYVIYMTVKKSTFYLTGQEITLRSDPLPLKKFLNHRTLNNTVDNWAVELKALKSNLYILQARIMFSQTHLADSLTLILM